MQVKARRRSWPQSVHWRRVKPEAKVAAAEKGLDGGDGCGIERAEGFAVKFLVEGEELVPAVVEINLGVVLWLIPGDDARTKILRTFGAFWVIGGWTASRGWRLNAYVPSGLREGSRMFGLGILEGYFKTAARKGAVTDFLFLATSSGVPWAMIWPPRGPASGPRSMR